MPKKERQQADRIVTLFFGIGFLYTGITRSWLPFIILIAFSTVIYLAFFRQMHCDVEREDGGSCGNTAYGWLGACHLGKHKRIKRNAILVGLRLRRPAPEPLPRWQRGARRTTMQEEAAPTPESGKVTRLAYDCAMLFATIAGSIASVVALVASK